MCKLILTIVNQKSLCEKFFNKKKRKTKQLFKFRLSKFIKKMSIYYYCFMIIN